MGIKYVYEYIYTKVEYFRILIIGIDVLCLVWRTSSGINFPTKTWIDAAHKNRVKGY
jgi:predicted anti-sigma-YlaC factor YlaD